MSIEFFAEMAWKSALISAAALALASALRSRSPADRAMVLRLGVAMLLLLPFIALGAPAIEIAAFAAPEAPFALHPLAADAQRATAPGAELPQSIWDDPTPLVLLAYLGGLAMASGRLVAGLWTLRGWTRRAHEVDCPEWRAAFERVRWIVPHADAVRLLVSEEVNSPLSWGWRRPVILIDTDTLREPADAEGILAHEAAHVARRDWPMLMASQVAAALFWFNPLVWKLEREAVQQAEEAADIAAAERVEPARYAETLLSWAQVNRVALANSIAPSGSALGRRVRAVLDGRLRERPSGSPWTALAMLLCLAIAAPVAAARLVAAEPEALPAPRGSEAPRTSAVPKASAEPRGLGDILVSVPPIPDAAPISRDALAAVMPQIPAIVAGATGAVDRDEMAEEMGEAAEAMAEARAELREAQAELRRRPIERGEIEAAMREAARARVQARHDVRLAMREAERARQSARVSMRRGAEGMMRGADGMERGARNMEEEARRLQDRDYRERQIARARARGDNVTHEELLEAAEGLREGAEGMREGAEGMREAAREMREGGD